MYIGPVDIHRRRLDKRLLIRAQLVLELDPRFRNTALELLCNRIRKGGDSAVDVTFTFKCLFTTRGIRN